MEDVCRLCGGDYGLINIFHEKDTELFKEIIYVSSSVKIKEDDPFSTMVCANCCKIAVKLHKYRISAISNDKLLKEEHQFKNIKLEKTLAEVAESVQLDLARTKYHPSVVQLVEENTNIIIPSQILYDDVLPVVTLNKDEVTDWYAQRLRLVKLQASNTAIKKTICQTARKRVSHLELLLNNVQPIDISNSVENIFKRKMISSMNDPTPTAKKKKIDGYLSPISMPIKPSSNDRIEVDYNLQSELNYDAVISSKRNENNRSSITETNDTGLNGILINETPSEGSSFQNDFLGFEDNLFMESSKSLEVFICRFCNIVCDTKKLVLKHEKLHLTCKFCKKTLKNMTALKHHLNKTCIINVTTKKPIVRLTRVDSIPSVLLKYPEAFENYRNTDFSNGSNNKKCDSDIENAKTDSSNSNTIQTQKINEIVYISDDPNGDIEYTVISTAVPTKPTKNMNHDDSDTVNTSNAECVDLTENENEFVLNKSFYFLSKQYSNENKMMESLLRRNLGAVQCRKGSQTFQPINNNIKRTSNNLVVLEHLYLELLRYKIRVELEKNTVISARFEIKPLQNKVYPREYWGHKKPINVKLTHVYNDVKTNLAAKVIPNQSSNVIDGNINSQFQTAKVTSIPSSQFVHTFQNSSGNVSVNTPLLAHLLCSPTNSTTTNATTTSNSSSVVPIISTSLPATTNSTLVKIPILSNNSANNVVGVIDPNTIIQLFEPSCSNQNLIINGNFPPFNKLILFKNVLPNVPTSIPPPLCLTSMNTTKETIQAEVIEIDD
ncbi:hypothetical protein FQA39_LY15584 [Lamprigera yunnana]|nr:hypothetical protein FQA39_LY15584 [Lamprigera yunnana]